MNKPPNEPICFRVPNRYRQRILKEFWCRFIIAMLVVSAVILIRAKFNHNEEYASGLIAFPVTQLIPFLDCKDPWEWEIDRNVMRLSSGRFFNNITTHYTVKWVDYSIQSFDFETKTVPILVLNLVKKTRKNNVDIRPAIRQIRIPFLATELQIINEQVVPLLNSIMSESNA